MRWQVVYEGGAFVYIRRYEAKPSLSLGPCVPWPMHIHLPESLAGESLAVDWLEFLAADWLENRNHIIDQFARLRQGLSCYTVKISDGEGSTEPLAVAPRQLAKLRAILLDEIEGS